MNMNTFDTLAQTLKRTGLAFSDGMAREMAQNIESTERKVQTYFDNKKESETMYVKKKAMEEARQRALDDSQITPNISISAETTENFREKEGEIVSSPPPAGLPGNLGGDYSFLGSCEAVPGATIAQLNDSFDDETIVKDEVESDNFGINFNEPTNEPSQVSSETLAPKEAHYESVTKLFESNNSSFNSPSAEDFRREALKEINSCKESSRKPFMSNGDSFLQVKSEFDGTDEIVAQATPQTAPVTPVAPKPQERKPSAEASVDLSNIFNFGNR